MGPWCDHCGAPVVGASPFCSACGQPFTAQAPWAPPGTNTRPTVGGPVWAGAGALVVAVVLFGILAARGPSSAGPPVMLSAVDAARGACEQWQTTADQINRQALSATDFVTALEDIA